MILLIILWELNNPMIARQKIVEQ